MGQSVSLKGVCDLSIVSHLMIRPDNPMMIRVEAITVLDQHHFQSEADCSQGFMTSPFMWTLNWFATMHLAEKRGSQWAGTKRGLNIKLV